MTRSLAILASLVFATACASRSSPGTPTPELSRTSIFRTIDISPFGQITLSKPFDQRGTLGVPVRDRTYFLGGGRFADTDSILVTVDTLGRVEAIEFVYGGGKSFTAAVAEYEALIGPATSRHTRMGRSVETERVTWNDGATLFELVRQSWLGGRTVVRSTMRDVQAPISRPQN